MERRAIAVHGIVQGVGFRPFVSNLADRLRLAGFVRNDQCGVRIEIEGDEPMLDQFLNEIVVRPPPQARIETLRWTRSGTRGDVRFRIEPSDCGGTARTVIPSDIATCEQCLRELFDTTNRRNRHPFISCCHCGPRFTIMVGLPFDRERTTMARFRMCAECQAEYENPHDRRFHAQTLCCPMCGPQLRLIDPDGTVAETDNPVTDFAVRILQGRIGALKGLGGYHLVCDARNEAAVTELRRRKHREEKPFAVMVANQRAADALCGIAQVEAEHLHSVQRPIMLLQRRRQTHIAGSVAPGHNRLGVMLPYAPVHHLLLSEVHGAPLVMTSGNCRDEPIAFGDHEAFERLSDISDVFLTHDRAIAMRCDDSVVSIVSGRPLVARRSRGYAPQPIQLPLACREPILALGGQGKVTFALGHGRHALLSHHVGDLEGRLNCQALQQDVAHSERLSGVSPSLIVHDLHPDYYTTAYALKRARETGVRRIAVQHHHAHLAGCMAEHQLVGTTLGVVFDGAGWGIDGTIWGGEFLVGDYGQFVRVAHLRQIGMPGGEQAIREPWRMALAYLRDAGLERDCFQQVPHTSRRVIEQMLARGLNCPLTSSAGRLFDAVAAILGLREHAAYEGQPAIALELLAAAQDADHEYPFEVDDGTQNSPEVVDTRPLICAIADDMNEGVDAARIARRFHSTLVCLIAAVCDRVRDRHDVRQIALSGGVFMNRLLASELEARLVDDGFQVYTHGLVPPNDGGLSLGQLAIAVARMSETPG